MTLERCVEQTRISPEIRGLRGTVNLDQTNPEILNDNGIDLRLLRPVCLTGGLLTTQHNSRDRNLPKALTRFLRTLGFCPHNNIGWRCAELMRPGSRRLAVH